MSQSAIQKPSLKPQTTSMVVECLLHLYTPHIQLSVRSLSQAENFNHRFNHTVPEGFPVPHKEGHLLVDGYIKIDSESDSEYPFELGKVINYTLDGVSIHPVSTKIQASFLTQLPERKETAQGFHHEACLL